MMVIYVVMKYKNVLLIIKKKKFLMKTKYRPKLSASTCLYVRDRNLHHFYGGLVQAVVIFE